MREEKCPATCWLVSAGRLLESKDLRFSKFLALLTFSFFCRDLLVNEASRVLLGHQGSR